MGMTRSSATHAARRRCQTCMQVVQQPINNVHADLVLRSLLLLCLAIGLGSVEVQRLRGTGGRRELLRSCDTEFSKILAMNNNKYFNGQDCNTQPQNKLEHCKSVLEQFIRISDSKGREGSAILIYLLSVSRPSRVIED